jgi:hypothetical protein
MFWKAAPEEMGLGTFYSEVPHGGHRMSKEPNTEGPAQVGKLKSRLASALRHFRTAHNAVILLAAVVGLQTLSGCGGGMGGTIPPSNPSSSPIVAIGTTLQVTSHSMKMSFSASTISSMTNLLTGERVVQAPGVGLIDLNMQVPTGSLLQPGNWTTQSDSSTGTTVGVLSLSDSQRQVTMTVGIDASTDEIFVRLAGTSSQPGVRGLVWGVQGFDPSGKFLLPAHGGLAFDANTEPSHFSFAYPTHWESQFAVYQSSLGGVLLYARDPQLNFKQLQGTRAFSTLDLSLETFAQGPYSSATQVPSHEYRFHPFSGSWQHGVDAYRAWSQSVFPAPASDPRREWAAKIRAVFTVVDPNPAFVDLLAAQFDPAKTLINFVHWRNAIFDANYPDYTPSPDAAAFVQHAHALGFHVMLHVNVAAVATYNSAYSQVSQYQVRDPETGQLVYWPWGLWPAGPPPPPYLQSYAFISPASSQFRTLLLNSLQPAITALQPDALHLDAGGVMLNDGNGLVGGMTSIQGMIQLHKDIVAQYPQLVLGYESETESLAPYHRFAQRWAGDFTGHPVSTYLLGNELFYGFLDQPNPDEAGFVDYIRRYETQGIIPGITVAHNNDLDPGLPITPRIVQMIKLWQQYDFHPDWGGDWSNVLFRWISADGATTATVSADANTVSLNAAGQQVYQRLRNSNAIPTPVSLWPPWSAYDATSLYGLDPTTEYWAQSGGSRPANTTRISTLPQGVELGPASLDEGDYAYFELVLPPQQPFDFVREFQDAKVGVASGDGKDYHLAFGASAQVSQALVRSKLRTPIIAMQPPYGPYLGGATFVEYSVALPSTPSALAFSAGLNDLGTKSDGAVFKVTVNGTEVWKQQINLGEWVPAQVDLSAWAGTTAKIRFLIWPGQSLDPTDDLCAFGDLALTAAPSSTPVSFSLHLPAGTSNPSVSSGATITPTADPTVYSATTTLPAKFALFAKTPPALKVGDSLLSVPPTVWKKSYRGTAFPFVVEDSGTISPVSSGGQILSAISDKPPAEGYSLITWAVQLPADASTLTFQTSLADPPPPLTSVSYSGVDLTMFINGQAVWDSALQLSGWNPASVDLGPWRGQNVVITLQADADGSGIYDWSYWAGLTIQ